MNTTVLEAATNATVAANTEALVSSIVMPTINVPANATFSLEDSDEEAINYVSAYNTIKELINEQKEWFNGVHRTANEQLYLILQRCYDLYKSMAADAEVAHKIDQALDQHFLLRNMESKADTKLSKIIYCIFGTSDRRRVSSYAVALRIADDEGVTVDALPEFLRNAGGVEEVRRSKSSDAVTVDKIAVAKGKLIDALLTIDDRSLAALLKDKTKHNGKVVLVASQGANGTLIINAVEDGDAVVNATLTAMYNKNKKDWGAK
jgi:hypothetical protein